MSLALSRTPARLLGSIVAAAAAGSACVCACLTVVTIVSEPNEVSYLLRSLGALYLPLTAAYLVYFSLAAFIAARAARPKAALCIGAVLTGAIWGFMPSSGTFAESILEVWLTALSYALVASASLLLGSVALYKVGGWGHVREA